MSPPDQPVLGLSIGTTNVVAARAGRPPVVRRSVVTLWDDRAAEVGVPSQNPELASPDLAPGRVLRGFVERVGDPVPLVAADGSTHRSEALLTAALEAAARSSDDGRPVTGIVVAAPAHWAPGAIGALRGALRESPVLSPGGTPPLIVSDATAALAALQMSPGLPAGGVVALCDFGGSGSSITLADAGAGLAPIGETVRYPDFSGDQVDQALLHHVLAGIRSAGHDDTAGTAAVGALTRLREQCRLAKERLSTETATALPVDLPGYRSDIRLTRPELDAVIAEPFARFLDALADVLEHNRIPAAALTAVATVGGGAAIPGISQRLSESLRVPVITSPAPALTAATGAAVLAVRGGISDAPTGLAPIAAPLAADAPTNLAPTAWAAGGAGQAAGESAADGSPSATYRALAWSQGQDGADEPVPYTGADYYSAGDYAAETGARPVIQFEPEHPDTAAVAPPLPWFRRPPLLFGIAAALATLAVGGLAATLTSSDSTPTTATTEVTKSGETSGTSAPPPPVTTTVTGNNGQPTLTTITQTATPTTTSTPAPTTTTTTPTTTTTTTTTPTTTTTTTTTTTSTTTTTTPTTTTTTTAPPPTTTTAPPPPTTTAPPPPTTTVEPVITTTAAPPPITTQAAPETPVTKPAPLE